MLVQLRLVRSHPFRIRFPEYWGDVTQHIESSLKLLWVENGRFHLPCGRDAGVSKNPHAEREGRESRGLEQAFDARLQAFFRCPCFYCGEPMCMEIEAHVGSDPHLYLACHHFSPQTCMSQIYAHLQKLGVGDTVQVQTWREHLTKRHTLSTAQLQRLAEDTHRTACSALLRGGYAALHSLLACKVHGLTPDEAVAGVREYVVAARTVLSELVERASSWGIVPPHKLSPTAHSASVNGMLSTSSSSAAHVALVYVEKGKNAATTAMEKALERWRATPLRFSLPPTEHMPGTCAAMLDKLSGRVAGMEVEQLKALQEVLT